MLNRTLITIVALALASTFTQATAGEKGSAAAFQGNSFSRIADGDEWRLDFGDDGRLQVYLNGEAEATVNYTVSGQAVELVDIEGSCTGVETTGVYEWNISDETLEMTEKSDPCDRRRGVLTGGTWTAVE